MIPEHKDKSRPSNTGVQPTPPTPNPLKATLIFFKEAEKITKWVRCLPYMRSTWVRSLFPPSSTRSDQQSMAPKQKIKEHMVWNLEDCFMRMKYMLKTQRLIPSTIGYGPDGSYKGKQVGLFLNKDFLESIKYSSAAHGNIPLRIAWFLIRILKALLSWNNRKLLCSLHCYNHDQHPRSQFGGLWRWVGIPSDTWETIYFKCMNTCKDLWTNRLHQFLQQQGVGHWLQFYKDSHWTCVKKASGNLWE